MLHWYLLLLSDSRLLLVLLHYLDMADGAPLAGYAEYLVC